MKKYEYGYINKRIAKIRTEIVKGHNEYLSKKYQRYYDFLIDQHKIIKNIFLNRARKQREDRRNGIVATSKGRKVKVSEENYINNNEFYLELYEFLIEDEGNGEIPEHLWSKFQKLSYRIAHSFKFSNGYADSCKEDLITEGVIICVKKIASFNPDKSLNPFSFFTTVITNSYNNKINREIKENQKKDACLKLYDIKRELNESGSCWLAERIHCGF